MKDDIGRNIVVIAIIVWAVGTIIGWSPANGGKIIVDAFNQAPSFSIRLVDGFPAH